MKPIFIFAAIVLSLLIVNTQFIAAGYSAVTIEELKNDLDELKSVVHKLKSRKICSAVCTPIRYTDGSSRHHDYSFILMQQVVDTEQEAIKKFSKVCDGFSDASFMKTSLEGTIGDWNGYMYLTMTASSSSSFPTSEEPKKVICSQLMPSK